MRLIPNSFLLGISLKCNNHYFRNYSIRIWSVCYIEYHHICRSLGISWFSWGLRQHCEKRRTSGLRLNQSQRLLDRTDNILRWQVLNLGSWITIWSKELPTRDKDGKVLERDYRITKAFWKRDISGYLWRLISLNVKTEYLIY